MKAGARYISIGQGLSARNVRKKPNANKNVYYGGLDQRKEICVEWIYHGERRSTVTGNRLIVSLMAQQFCHFLCMFRPSSSSVSDVM